MSAVAGRAELAPAVRRSALGWQTQPQFSRLPPLAALGTAGCGHCLVFQTCLFPLPFLCLFIFFYLGLFFKLFSWVSAVYLLPLRSQPW